MNEYATDYPINTNAEDKFQRGHFSKRIAETIYNYKNERSLVIGLYGEWGSGKSSVLNLIESHLHEIDSFNDNLITIKFNPWRFSDEKSLLLSFFDNLAKAIEIELKNKQEKFGEFVSKYAAVLAPISGADDVAKAIGCRLSQENIEVLKQRLDDAIRETKKKILIIIDDVDRLDKEEIYSLLRLVKLNADFPNTIYLLSFDEEMVAKAISERFSSTGEEAGRSFLEKIIQVSLHLPKLLQNDLISYSFNEISNTINSLDLSVSTEDIDVFPQYFRDCLVQRIDTPRLVIRYINSIRFSLPLLYNEVNVSDLLLIEAIKILYPRHYKYIKENPTYFIRSYSDKNSQKEKDFLKQELEKLSESYNKEDKEKIQKLITHLFPNLKSLYANLDNSRMYQTWLKNKRICTSQYHERYFIYAVLKGDLSDFEFKNYIDSILKLKENECNKTTLSLIENSSEEALLTKLQTHYADYSDEICRKISLAICSFGSKLSPNNSFSFLFSSQRQYARIVVDMVQKSKDAKFKLLKELFNKTDSLIFIDEIWDVLEARVKEDIITQTERNELAWILIKRAKKEVRKKPMFEVEEINTYVIFKLWFELDQHGFTEYIHKFLEKKPSRVLSILKDSAGTIVRFGEDRHIKVSLQKENYDHMKSIYNIDYLYDCIIKSYPSKINDDPIWLDHPQEVTDDNIYIGQFLSFYKEDTI